MSWRARIPEDSKYFAATRTLPPPHSKLNHAGFKLKKPVIGKQPFDQEQSNWLASTTMTGFPWRVRDKIEGKLIAKPIRKDEPGTRLANYSFTYGLSKDDVKQLQYDPPSGFETSMITKPTVRTQSHNPSSIRNKLSASSVAVSERLKQMKKSFHIAGMSSQLDHPTPYFRDWGKELSKPNEGRAGQLLNESSTLLESTRNILHKTGLIHSRNDEGLVSYFEGLDGMDEKEKSPLDISTTDLQQGLSAFQPPSTKPSRIQPKTYYEVGKSMDSFQNQSTINESNDKTRDMVLLLPPKPQKLKKKVKANEPDPSIFIKSPQLRKSHRKNLIDKQLKRETASSSMTYEEYNGRKKELMEAALKAYDRDLPTYEVMPDIRDEVIEAQETKNEIDRANVIDLLYNALTNQSTSISMKAPSTSLHLSNSDLRERQKISNFSRPLDQFQGPVVSTILRELQEAKSKDGQSREFTPTYTNRVSRHIPKTFISKEKIRALRALENYDLSKLRQQNSTVPKPVLTLHSVKNAPTILSKFSNIGSSGPGTEKPYSTFSSLLSRPPKFPSNVNESHRNDSMTTIKSRRGSDTALSIQTRNEKYTNGKIYSAPGPSQQQKSIPKTFNNNKRTFTRRRYKKNF